MTVLPEKPFAVAHVSDAHWEAALEYALRLSNSKSSSLTAGGNKYVFETWADHARCLILLGEVPVPVDPIEAAIVAAYRRHHGLLSGYSPIPELFARFDATCRKHFAGLTFPVQS